MWRLNRGFVFLYMALTAALAPPRALAQSTPAIPIYRLGGEGVDGRFEYNGEGAGACSDDICRGGTCTGTTPTGTCTLAANSAFLHVPTSATPMLVSVVREYDDWLLTAGTLTITDLDEPEGQAIVIRSAGDLIGTGGTITMVGRGARGATGGACASSNAGKRGGHNVFAGGAAGASGNNPGTAGLTTVGGTFYFHNFYNAVTVGTGGGTGPVSGQTAARDITYGLPAIGATGGGGPGCAAACSGTFGRGGDGGGMIHSEAAGTIDLTGVTVDASGEAGQGNGSSGGGSGTIFYVGKVITAVGTPVTTGGAAGGASPTNCGAGAAGGAGTYRALQLF
jgi:hypothetical protein